MAETAVDVGALEPFVRAELARRRLLDFATYMDPSFELAEHLRLLAGELEAVERGEPSRRRVIANVPPRFGKSRLTSQMFTAWYLGRNPRKNIILGSFGQELADRNSRAARALVEDDRWPFDARLAADSTAVHRWNLREGGGVFAVGVGGGITGRGADVLILDDLHNDAGTEGDRERVYQWFSTIAVPRLEPNGSIVLIGTRFHEADVFGRILESPLAKDWRVVRIPAFAEVDDPLGRDVGSSLWSSRVSPVELAERREAMGSRAFESQFQQNPLPAGGGLIKAEWLEHFYTSVPEDARTIMALDSASKTGISNDYSVLVVLASTKTHHHLVDVIRRRVELPDLRRMVLGAYQRHKPSAIYVEDTANAVGLIQELRRETTLPIVPVQAKGSKQSRIEGITGLLEAGKLLLPDERKVTAPYLVEFVRECLGYPGAKFDDQPDCLALALSKAARPSSGFCFAKLSNPPMPILRRW